MSKIKNFYHDEITKGLHLTSDDSDYSYAEWLEADRLTTNARVSTEAERLGILAHREGRVRTPYHDPALRALLNETSWSHTVRASEAWLRGWDHERAIEWEAEQNALAQIAQWEAEEADRETPRFAY